MYKSLSEEIPPIFDSLIESWKMLLDVKTYNDDLEMDKC